MRNLYMNLKGNSQGGVNIMLDAHSDEVGFIVQAVKSNGLLRFLPLGGWDVKQAGTLYECFRAGKGSGFCRCID